MWTVASAAAALLAAEDTRTTRAPLTDSWPDLDADTAYAIQDETLRRRLARGELLEGVKLGLTSRAKQQRMNVDTPIVAWLTDAMVLPPGEPIRRSALIHPRVEPELVFVLGEPLTGPGVTAEAALAAVASVHAGLEVIDSRYADFRFTLPDVVADNASSGSYVVSPTGLSPDGLDLVGEECVLEVDGQVVDRATGAAVLGHPAEALALAANVLARRGQRLEAGWTVLSGGMTDAVPAGPGVRIAAHFTHLGTVVLDGGTDADH